MKILITWGALPFSIESLPYESFAKSVNFRHASNSRIGARASQQYLGIGEETITLTGKLLPTITGGRNAINLLRLQAASGKAYPLIERTGTVHGMYICTQADEVASIFEHTGAPHKVEFTLTFKRVGDDKLETAGMITSQIGSLV